MLNSKVDPKAREKQKGKQDLKTFERKPVRNEPWIEESFLSVWASCEK